MFLFWFLVFVPASVYADAPQAIGGGYALHFNRLRSDVLSFVWENQPLNEQGVTMEFWVKLTDDLQRRHTVLGSGVFDASESPPYSNPYEFEAIVYAKSASLYRGLEGSAVSYPNASNPVNEWVHVALANNFTDSTVSAYKNGVFIGTYVGSNSTFGIPLRTFMLVHFGQEAVLLGSQFIEFCSFDGAVDEFRVWDSVRTADQIAANYNLKLDVIPPELNLHFDFDTPDEIQVDAASQHAAWVGRLAQPKNYMDWTEGRLSGPPTSPVFVASRAPVVSSLHVVLLNAEPGLTTEFSLPYVESASAMPTQATIVSAPAAGILTAGGVAMADGSNTNIFDLVYDPQTAAGDVLEECARMSFLLSNGDGASQVVELIFVWNEVIQATPPLKVRIMEDSMSPIVLSGVDRYATTTGVEIVELPEVGSLYVLAFDPSATPDIESVLTTTEGRLPLTEDDLPFRITNGRGIIQYNPPLDVLGDDIDVFWYQWLVKGEVMERANVTISVESVNDAPATEDMLANDLNIQLQASDLDENFADRFYFFIVDHPRFGHLHDVANDHPVPTKQLPLVFDFVKEVVDGSAQWTDCANFEICSIVDQGYCAEQAGCFDLNYHADNMRGPPDFYPSYGDTGLGWGPSFEFENDWLVLELNVPMYIREIQVYEVYNPGTIVEISVANAYDRENPDATTWEVVWSASEPKFPPPVSRAWSPPLCPKAIRAQFVRLYTDSSSGIYSNLDAVSFVGNTDLDNGVLSSSKIRYVPANGIHAADPDVPLDVFSYKASDCESQSPKSTVSVKVPEPPALEMTYFLTVETDIVVHQETGTTQLNLTGALKAVIDDLHMRGKEPQLSDTTVTIVNADAALKFQQSESGKIAALPLTLPNAQFVWVSVYKEAYEPCEVYVTSQHQNIVHRIQFLLRPICGDKLYQLDSSSPCRVCGSFSEKEESSLSTDTFQEYRAKCPAPPLETNFVLLGVVGLILLATATFFLLIALNRGPEKKQMRKFIKGMFLECGSFVTEISDLVTDVMVCINAMEGTNPNLAPYKFFYLIFTIVGVLVTIIGVLVKVTETVRAKSFELKKTRTILKEKSSVKSLPGDNPAPAPPPNPKLTKAKSSWVIRHDGVDKEVYSTKAELMEKANGTVMVAQLTLASAFVEDFPMIVLNLVVIANGKGIEALVLVSLGLSLLMFGTKVNAIGPLRAGLTQIDKIRRGSIMPVAKAEKNEGAAPPASQ